jgi:uncharacterized protein YraI
MEDERPDQAGPPAGANAPPQLDFAPDAPPPEAGGAEHDLFAVLRNRFILGGLGVLAVLLLVAIVLVVIGGGDDGDGGQAGSATPGGPTVVNLTGFTGQLRNTVSMRNGPDTSFAILGTIPKDAVVTVVGRNEDETWLQVRYPPSSQLRGWVPAEFVDVRGDISELRVAAPGREPSIDVPTSEFGEEPFVPAPTDTPAVIVEEPALEPTEPQNTLPPPPATSTRAPTRTPRPPTAVPQPTSTPLP